MKEIITANEAINMVKSESVIMVGGFGLVGCPIKLVESLSNSSLNNLTIISNNLGEQGKGLGKLVLNKQVAKGIGSYFTSNIDVVEAYQRGELEIELLPQGTMSEAIRAGGAGIGGFYTPVSVGTALAEPKETKIIGEKEYVLQEALQADFAFIKAKKADKLGNLIYSKSSRNFNPAMATAAKTVFVEVDEIVEVGELNPEEIITPHLYVDYLIEGE
ncbi:CoA transferase subunit A [Pseudogracilibacillus auburnensis]|uniref:3-oxoacid CoA-transferase subunit A n=1 Tax=Pseudogracilibacillus auburnensis TaxID=1494959 RepID=A0A2V3W479_9BACI|nr:3-oxoacid CoA-transferase subunit A [Pseudogracilibacillus auburnensis]MBO1002768.1 CoA transferase subunit A [Pseudogracilibacillus auburnensis]PXW87881.1 3-oxoacid CoA-transferase subunit A [Pseudogracilibacillus auburnensis]